MKGEEAGFEHRRPSDGDANLKILGQSNKKFWGKNCSLKEPWAGQKCPYLLNVLVKLHRLLWAVQEELGLSLKAEADLGGTKIWNLSAQ